MTLEPTTLLDLNTDAIAVLFKIAVHPPDWILRKQTIEVLLGLKGHGLTAIVQPLVDREWVTGSITKGYQLTPSGTAAVRSLIAFANQTLSPT